MKATATSLSLLLLGSLATSAAAQTELYRIDGPVSGDRFGSSIGNTGDIDGDAVADFVVGSPGANGGAGAAMLVNGATGTPLTFFAGGDPGDALGTSVAGAGDVNGDNVPDVIVGVPGDDNGNGVDAGAAIVYSGAGFGVLQTLIGDAAFDGFGFSVAGAGRIDGDALDDVIVGAPGDDTAGAEAGSARVMSVMANTVIWSWDGAAAGDQFGYAVSGAGNTNPTIDSIPDLVIGAPFSNLTGPGNGTATVYSGANAAQLRRYAGTPGEFFGATVGGAGDLDGDGSSEVVVGGPLRTVSANFSLGRVSAYSIPLGTRVWFQDGALAGDEFGRSLAVIPDTNSDGRAEILAGAPGVLDRPGSVRILDGATGSVLNTFNGVAVGDEFGMAVGYGGDIDGNGIPSLLCGAPGAIGYASVNGGRVIAYEDVPDFITVGAGCTGTDGTLALGLAGPPTIGGTLQATLSGANNCTAAVCILSVPLGFPIDLMAVVGVSNVPGCNLLINPALWIDLTAGGTTPDVFGDASTAVIPIDSNPELFGPGPTLQWLAIHPVDGVLTSDAGTIIFR